MKTLSYEMHDIYLRNTILVNNVGLKDPFRINRFMDLPKTCGSRKVS